MKRTKTVRASGRYTDVEITVRLKTKKNQYLSRDETDREMNHMLNNIAREVILPRYDFTTIRQS